MMFRKTILLTIFILASVTSLAQVTLYMGGDLQGNYAWIRGDEPVMGPGVGGGVSLVYWEHEYWYVKTGINYNHATSTILEYPDDYGVTPENADDKINITYTEQTVGIPMAFYYRPYEWRSNSLLITGSMQMLMVASLKASSEEYGDLMLKGAAAGNRIKANLGIGVGYQRQLDRYLFLNIIPSFNIDLRGEKPYSSIRLTAELLVGVY
jgi:hypothetical protein